MKSFLTQLRSFIATLGFMLLLGGCSIFKEDDCGCPTFGSHVEDNKPKAPKHARK